MKKSVVQYVAGSLGMFLVIVGVIWTCQKLSSPPQLNAASNSGKSGTPKAIAQTSKTSLSLNTGKTGSLAPELLNKASNDNKNPSFPTQNEVLISEPVANQAFPVSLETDYTETNNTETDYIEEPSDSIHSVSLEPDLSSPLISSPAEDFDSSLDTNYSAPNPLSMDNTNYVSDSVVVQPLENQAPYSQNPTFDPNAGPIPSNNPLDNSVQPANQTEKSNRLLNQNQLLNPNNQLTQNSLINQNNPLIQQDQTLNERNRELLNNSTNENNYSKLAANLPSNTYIDGQEFGGQNNREDLTNFSEMQQFGIGRPGSDQISGPQQAQVMIEKVLPEEVQIGQETEFKIVLKNIGQSPAKNIELKDLVPAGTILVATTPQAMSTGQGELLWNGFDLESGESREFSYIVLPQEEGEIGSVATVGFQTEISGKTRCTRPMLQIKVDAPQEVLIGENVTFDITISNPGTGTATGVVLLENVPEGLNHPSGNVLDNRIETLKPQETKKVSLTLQSVSPGIIENHMKVSADNGLSEEVITQIQVNAPELSLAINGSKYRYLERNAVYNLTVQNPGTAVAKDIKLIVELPQEMEFVSTNNLGAYDSEKHCVHWELAELPNNIAAGEIELVLLPKRSGTSNLIFKGKGEHELAAEVSQEIVIDGLSAVSYEVKALTDPVEVGRDAVYEIRIANRGTKESKNVSLQIFLPEQMKILASDGPTRCNEKVGGVFFDSIPKLDAKSEVVYKIKAVCSVPGDHRIKVQVSSDDLEPLIKEESIRIFD
ncbi:MAG: hypothetical protein Q4C95_01155 [Planctomycetia bacterium]|nr:hypothetical protein [Planctomycetia bacterium]